MTQFQLRDLIDVAVLQEIQDGFSKYTKMAALTTEADGTPITIGSGFSDFCMNLTRKSELGCKRCEECDKNGALQTLQNGKPSVYSCHAGLVDFAAPIMVEGKFFGSFIGGQVRTEPVNEMEMTKRAVELGIDPKAYVEAAKKTPLLEREEIEQAAEFLASIAKVLSEMAYRNYKALQQSRKMEQAARSQSAFIMNLSTNMQEDIKSWVFAAKQAVESNDTTVMKNTIRELLNQYEEAYSAVEDAVEYMRMAGDELEMLETEYNVYELIQRVAAAAQKHVGNQEIFIISNFSESVPKYLLGDPGRIGQIVDKLLQYILGYKQKGNILLEVSCQTVSYATELEICIKDENQEILPDKIEEIKKYFSKKNIHTTNVDDSTGLSFSFISLLAGQLSGKVEVGNWEETGTLFKLSLPQLEIKEKI